MEVGGREFSLHGRVVQGVGHLGHDEDTEAGSLEFDPRLGHYEVASHVKKLSFWRRYSLMFLCFATCLNKGIYVPPLLHHQCMPYHDQYSQTTYKLLTLIYQNSCLLVAADDCTTHRSDAVDKRLVLLAGLTPTQVSATAARRHTVTHTDTAKPHRCQTAHS